MPEITKFEPGSPCWLELSAVDRKVATGFYTNLFGWEAVENPMGPDMVYVMLRKNERNAAALYQRQDPNIPPHWATYFSVASADDAAAKAKALGASVTAGPFDVMTFGRMAFLSDPQGASFALWQPADHHGMEIMGEPGTFCWAELTTPDGDGARRFYGELFGWQPKVSPQYTEWQLGGRAFGGMMEMTGPEWTGVPPHWMPYFAVDSCDHAAARVQELGGKVCVPPTDIPNVGRFAVVNDSEGAFFSIIKLG